MYARARRGEVIGVLCGGCLVESDGEAAGAIERVGRALYLSALMGDRANERTRCPRCGDSLAGTHGDRRGGSGDE
jgi:hypothetical protein